MNPQSEKTFSLSGDHSNVSELISFLVCYWAYMDYHAQTSFEGLALNVESHEDEMLHELDGHDTRSHYSVCKRCYNKRIQRLVRSGGIVTLTPKVQEKIDQELQV